MVAMELVHISLDSTQLNFWVYIEEANIKGEECIKNLWYYFLTIKKDLLFINVFNIFQLYSLHVCNLDIYTITLNLLTHFNLYSSFTISWISCHTPQKSIHT